MPPPRETAGKSAGPAGPWSPFWAAVRQAADALRQAHAASQMPAEDQE